MSADCLQALAWCEAAPSSEDAARWLSIAFTRGATPDQCKHAWARYKANAASLVQQVTA